MSSNMGGIFIGGMDRSGTTLVQAMLNAHPSVLVTYEATLPVSLHGRFARLRPDDVPALINAIRAHEFFSAVSERAIREAIVRDNPSFDEVIGAAYKALAGTQGKTVWGDKSPGYANHYSFLAERFPDSRLIHIFRDPRAVAYSLIQQSWGPNTAMHAANAWLETVTTAVEALRRLDSNRSFSICYESLVTKSSDVIGDLCSFLDIEPHPAMLDGATRADSVPQNVKDIHPAVGTDISTDHMEKWRALSARDIATIESVCGHLMDELGYEQVSGSGARGLGLERRIFYGLQRRWRTILRKTRR